MEGQYNISGEVIPVSYPYGWDAYVRNTVGAHYNIALAVIVVLVIVVLFLLYKKYEGFSANDSVRNVTVSLSGSDAFKRERATDSSNPSYFQSDVQTAPTGQWSYDPTADPSNPNSLSYQVLHDPTYNCAAVFAPGYKMAPKDAWTWMAQVAGADQGSMTGSVDTSGYAVDDSANASTAVSGTGSTSESLMGRRKNDNQLSYIMNGH